MFGRLLLLFLIVPVVEVTLLITLGERMGFGATFALVVASALLGSWLARREGVAAWRRVQSKLAEGGLPGPELVDGLVVLISATLLIAPGFLTDAAGLLGLFPPTRALARRALVRRFERGIALGHGPRRDARHVVRHVAVLGAGARRRGRRGASTTGGRGRRCARRICNRTRTVARVLSPVPPCRPRPTRFAPRTRPAAALLRASR